MGDYDHVTRGVDYKGQTAEQWKARALKAETECAKLQARNIINALNDAETYQDRALKAEEALREIERSYSHDITRGFNTWQDIATYMASIARAALEGK